MKIAVTGGTGRIGGRVVRLLTEGGQHEVIALSSRTAPYDDPAALRTAMSGVDTLVAVSSDGEAAKVAVHHLNVVQAAAASGVGHVVALSGLDVDPDSPFCYAYTNAVTEMALRATGLPHSIVRAGLFAEFFRGLVRQAADGVGGTVALPAANARISLVAREDVARCLAALALRTPADRHYEVTMPRPLDVAAITEAAGYHYTEAEPGEFTAALARLGEDPWWNYAYSSMFASIRQHRWQTVSGAVVELTGRPPLSLGQVLARD